MKYTSARKACMIGLQATAKRTFSFAKKSRAHGISGILFSALQIQNACKNWVSESCAPQPALLPVRAHRALELVCYLLVVIATFVVMTGAIAIVIAIVHLLLLLLLLLLRSIVKLVMKSLLSSLVKLLRFLSHFL